MALSKKIPSLGNPHIKVSYHHIAEITRLFGKRAGEQEQTNIVVKSYVSKAARDDGTPPTDVHVLYIANKDLPGELDRPAAYDAVLKHERYKGAKGV